MREGEVKFGAFGTAEASGLARQPLVEFDLLPGVGAPSNDERAQVQPQLAIDPIDPLIVPQMLLHIGQRQEAQPKAPRIAGIDQPDQQVGDLFGRVL